MPLDPQAKSILELLNAPLDTARLTPEALRAGFRALATGRSVPEVSSVEDRRIPGPGGAIAARLYRPAQGGTLPLLVYFHGGGFVVCDLDTHDATARLLANAAGCAVLSIDYRLAPEAPFPAGVEDCYAATRWAAEHAAELGADPRRVAVGGDSAGGNLATVVTLLARERGGPRLSHQLLIYPVTDHSFDTRSYLEYAEGYFLTGDLMRWFWNHYLARPEDAHDPRASPLHAADLSGLPPATVITAEFDPLRDEGEAYAARLSAAGVPVELRRYDGMFHGFFGMTDVLDRAKEAVNWSASRLRTAFAV